VSAAEYSNKVSGSFYTLNDKIPVLSFHMPDNNFTGKPSTKVTYLKWNTPEGMKTRACVHDAISICAHEVYYFSNTVPK
jgi:hypothetical protein